MIKHPAVNAGEVRHAGLIPSSGDPLEQVAWSMPWTEEAAGPQSRVGHA